MNDPFRVGLLASLPLEMNDMCIVTHNYVYDQFCKMCYKNPVGRKNCRVFFAIICNESSVFPQEPNPKPFPLETNRVHARQ